MVQPWTETEKLGLLFQIIAKAGTIPWGEFTLPEGRTKKACEVMIDKEKSKLRKAREEAGEGDEESPTKRKATDDGEETSTPKKAKTPRKKEPTVKAGSDEEEAVKEEVKPEPEDEDEI